MRLVTAALVSLGLAACAARGPSDAEVRTLLEQRFQTFVAALAAGNVDAAVDFMEPQATLGVHGVVGPDGSVVREDLEGTAAIRQFLLQAGAPPELQMTPDTFTRSGASATQTGIWSMLGGQQGGTFSAEWHEDNGVWRLQNMRVDGGM